MRKKIKIQKGFIQIPILIAIIAAITVGIGTTIVLHKQGKLASITANISKVFKGKTIEIKESKPAIETLPETEEPQKEPRLTEEISSQQSQELEKAEIEVERLKKELETRRLAELKKQKEEEARKVVEETEEKAETKAKQEKLQQRPKETEMENNQPHLILYQDNLGNLYREEDFKREKEHPSTRGFVSSYSPWCLQSFSVEEWKMCEEETLDWIQNRSLNIGSNLIITLNSFDPDGDEVFYDVRYRSRMDRAYGTMRILQSWQWHRNNRFNISITDQLFNETFKERFGWSIHTFDPNTRKHGERLISLTNFGDLQVFICFNDKPEMMEYPFGEQFPSGCVLFQYFILKPGYSNLTTSTVRE